MAVDILLWRVSIGTYNFTCNKYRKKKSQVDISMCKNMGITGIKCYITFMLCLMCIEFLHFHNPVNVNTGNKAAHVKYGNQNNETPDYSHPSLARDLPSGFKIATWNVRSLLPSLDQIKIVLNDCKEADIIGFTESWLTDSILNSSFTIPDYKNAARRDRNYTTGGGVITFVSNNIPCEERHDLRQTDIEAVWLEVKFPHSSPLLVCTIYRPPDSTAHWYELCTDMLDKAFIENKEIIFMGDLNIDFLAPSSIPRKWSSVIETFALTQIVNEPTNDMSSTCIDHIYVTHPDYVKATKVASIGISDHFPVCYSRKHKQIGQFSHTNIKYRSFKNFQLDAFLTDLQCVPWSVCSVFNDANDALVCWHSLFIKVVDEHAPMKVRRVKKQRQPDWLTDEICDAIRKRDQYAKKKNTQEWRLARNRVNSLIKKSKSEYYKRAIEANLTDNKKLWSIMKEVLPQAQSLNPTYLLGADETPLSDPTEMADLFNDYFANVASNIMRDMADTPEYSNDLLGSFISSKLEPDTKFEISELTVERVLKYLQSLQDGKAVGRDSPSPKLLRLAAPVIAPCLTEIMNLSITTGIFPDMWKVARVVPLHKKGNPHDRTNYRPISVLSTLSKLLEKHVYSCFYSYLMNNKLLHPAQSGFRNFYSCETALTNLAEKWAKALDTGLLNGVIMIDLTKAFDLISHKILLRKLQMYQCADKSIDWFRSYLLDRKQCTAFKGSLSTQKLLTAGVPQGSILGPLFFILFMKDLPLELTHCDIDMYADDSTLTLSASNVPELNEKLSAELKNVAMWCCKNRMAINC